MSKTQAADIGMRIIAVIGGIVTFIESFLFIIGNGLMPYGFGILGTVLAIIFGIIAIALGLKPIHYTPFILLVIGILLIIVASLIGGIIILVAAIVGMLS